MCKATGYTRIQLKKRKTFLSPYENVKTESLFNHHKKKVIKAKMLIAFFYRAQIFSLCERMILNIFAFFLFVFFLLFSLEK